MSPRFLTTRQRAGRRADAFVGARHSQGIRSMCFRAPAIRPRARREDSTLKNATEFEVPVLSAQFMAPEQRLEEVSALLAAACRRAIRDCCVSSPPAPTSAADSDARVPSPVAAGPEK